MDRSQAIDLVSSTLTDAFDRGRFLLFIRNVLNHLDESEGRAKLWTKNVIKNAFTDGINHYERLGTYTDPTGDKVDVLVIHLRKETSLERGRSFLRNFVADYLSSGHGQGKSAVLAAFVSPTEEDWRFSFIKLEYSLEKTELGIVSEKKELTPARRYSFLVGRNETSHTAQKQFLPFLENDLRDPTLNQLEEAFSIEKVTEEFFLCYKDLFEDLNRTLEKTLASSRPISDHFEASHIDLADFAKKLLGQIVFLYFLQKKGWFGVERDAEWGSGEKRFLRYLFNNREALAPRGKNKVKRPVNFFNDILEPLFYEALAVERHDNYYTSFGCKIPFLNGGLFEPLQGYDWIHTDLLLPDTLFSNDIKTKDDLGTGILDVFDRYNFTVNEAEPLETEVAVDPEMLGKVFENLLPENLRHKGGAYYTPRVIVHYMCRQALISHLVTGLKDVNIDRGDLEVLIHTGERFVDFEANPTKRHADKLLPASIRDNASRIDGLLETIAVCDPAIGSGAFPVGMMHEIVRARLTLSSIPQMPHLSSYELKRHAIQESLYGVDIDPGAVEIAKLRLWLSLVVDEDDISKIKPLPNLDYKIMQGDSLLDEFEGVKLIDDRIIAPQTNEHELRRSEIDLRISELSRRFFDLHGQGKKTQAEKLSVEKDIRRLKKERDGLKDEPLEIEGELTDQFSKARKKYILLKRLHREFFDLQLLPDQKKKKREEIEKLEWEFMEETLLEKDNNAALAHLRKLRHAKRKPFFLWKLQFAEIFEKKRGFDIVLANPPFVRQEQIKHLKAALKNCYPECYTGVADLYVYFYAQGLKLLRKGGHLAYISSNSFLNSGFGEKLRNLLQRDTSLEQIIDFAETGVFEAITEPCIILLEKNTNPGLPVRCLKWDEKEPLSRLSQISNRMLQISQSSLTEDSWRLESPQIVQILEQMERAGKPLAEYVNGQFYYGIKTGFNKAFFVNRTTRDQLIKDHPSSAKVLKPLLRGQDIERWHVESPDLWIIFTRRGINIDDYPAIKRHLSQWKQSLTPGIAGGRKPGNYEWYEIQDNVAYWKEFERPKIVYQDIARYFGMAWDESGSYLGNTCYFIPNAEKWMLGVLLSSSLQFYVQKTIGSDSGGFIRLFSIHVSKFPIPVLDQEKKDILRNIVDYVLYLKQDSFHRSNKDVDPRDHVMFRYFEQLIDGLVYELFFKDHFEAAGKSLFDLVESETLPPFESLSTNKVEKLRAVFERLHMHTHPIRQTLFFLDTLEPVRIIEGKL